MKNEILEVQTTYYLDGEVVQCSEWSGTRAEIEASVKNIALEARFKCCGYDRAFTVCLSHDLAWDTEGS